MVESRRVAIHLLTIALIVCCSSNEGVLAGDVNQLNGLPEVQNLQLVRSANNDQQQSDENLFVADERGRVQRYLIRILDSEGNIIRQQPGGLSMAKLGQLLDYLQSDVPDPSPIVRRTQQQQGSSSYSDFPSKLLNGYLRVNPSSRQQQILDSQTTKSDLESKRDSASSLSQRSGTRRASPLLGIVWRPQQPSSNPTSKQVSNRRLGQNNHNLIKGSHHLAGTEEVALQPPMHSRSMSDYEWKRVENSRWNNLRGMWGKRDGNQQQQQHQSGELRELDSKTMLDLDEQQKVM